MGVVSRLCIFKEKGQPGMSVEEAVFLEDLGMEGDRYAKGGGRQVTLLASEAAEWMREQPQPGLCFKRYKANVETAGLDVSALRMGQTLSVGQVVFEVSEVSKECFAECALLQQGKECRLSVGGVFLKVVRGGTVCVGDKITML